MIEVEKILDELWKVPTKDWAIIYCEFNVHKFPKVLSHIKPKDWDIIIRSTDKTYFKIATSIMRTIEKTIGKMACNRENCKYMLDEEHAVFWKSHGRRIIEGKL